MIQILENSKFYCDQIASTQLLNRNRPADFRKLTTETFLYVHPDLKDALLKPKYMLRRRVVFTPGRSFETLLNPANKSHVIVSTLTASGKSLIYQIPVLNSILWDISSGLKGRHTTAFFIFPQRL